MDIFFIFIFVVINLGILIKYYRSKLGVFQAPFLMASASIAVFLPQIISFYLSDYYDNKLLPSLLFVICTCNMAFALGFRNGSKKQLPKVITSFDFEKAKVIMVFLTVLGLAAAFSIRGVWMNELEDKSNFIVMVNLASYMEIGFIFFLIYLLKHKQNDKIALILVVLTSLLYLETILLLGRRNVGLRLVLNLLFFYALYKPISYKFTKKIIIVLFLFGGVLNASIGTIRSNLGERSNIDIDYSANLEDSFAQKNFLMGMDIGNAAIGINYCYENDAYDYGLNIWNDFVYNFVPRFIVGEKVKSALQFQFGYEKIIPKITHGVTTMTGYFDAFSSFSYFAFIKFLFMGYFMGLIWRRSFTSELYLLMYMFLFTQVTSIFTHKTQYIFMRIEFLFMFFIPLVFYSFYKRRRTIRKIKTV